MIMHDGWTDGRMGNDGRRLVFFLFFLPTYGIKKRAALGVSPA